MSNNKAKSASSNTSDEGLKTSKQIESKKASVSGNVSSKEIELDMDKLLTPIAIIVGSIIISLSISMSVYFGLRNAELGSSRISASECSESDPLSVGCLVEMADKVGVNTKNFEKCLDEKKYDSVVTDEVNAGLQYNVQGTPSIFIGENKGDNMSGFSVGAGVTISEVDELVKLIDDKGISAAADYWKKKSVGNMDAYETQLRDYYIQQGQSGDTLSNSVKAGLAQREAEIEEEVKLQDIDFGEGMLKGSSDAKAVIMEFSDYECPFCQRFAVGVGKQIMDNYVDEGKVLFVYRDFPLESIHPNARRAAIAARCAGEDDKYFEFHDAIFKV